MKLKPRTMIAKRLLSVDHINVQWWEKIAHEGSVPIKHQLPLGNVIRINPYVTKPEEMIAAGWAPVKRQQ